MCSAVGVQEVCKGLKSLEDEEHSGQPLEVDNGQLRAIIKADPLTTTREVDKELSVDHSMVISIWSKLERWKGSISECLMSWPKIKKTKNIVTWSVILSNKNTTTMNHFSIGLWHAMKSRFCMTTSSVIGLGRSSKTLLKVKLALKNVMVTVWWSAAGLIHYSFLNPSKTIASEKYAQQINEMYPKLQCLQPALVNRKGPVFSTTTPKHASHNQCVKSWMNWATKFCLTCLIHLTSQQLTTISSRISTTFCREDASTINRR